MVEHRHLQLHCLGEAVPHRRRRLHEEGTLLGENEHVSMHVSALRTLEEQPRADVAWLPHAAWVPLAAGGRNGGPAPISPVTRSLAALRHASLNTRSAWSRAALNMVS